VQRAVLNFLAQDYSERELIIMVKDEGYAEQIRTFLSVALPSLLDQSSYPSISLRSHPFGDMQEAVVQAMAYAKGDWICIWDDDDLSHPSRLGEQLRFTPKDKASVLTKALYFFYESTELFVSGFEQPGGGPSERCVASSLIFCRQSYPGFDLSNQRQNRDKSSFSARYIGGAGAKGELVRLPNMPYMFVTCVHSDNMRGEEFHRRAASGLPTTRSRDWIIENEGELAEALDKYQWPDSDIYVSGKDAQAFVYVPEQRWYPSLEVVAVPEPPVVEAEVDGHTCPKGDPGERGEPGVVESAVKFESQLTEAFQEAVSLKSPEENPSAQKD
jgi:hypothetical protein